MDDYQQTIKLPKGELHVSAYDPLDKDLDLRAQFDKTFSHTIHAPKIGIIEAFIAFEVSLSKFKETHGDEIEFAKLDVETQLDVMDATTESIVSLAEQKLYGAVNGVALFQTWILSIIRKEDDLTRYIHAKLVDFSKSIEKDIQSYV